MEDLYLENILNHSGSPHNYGELECDTCYNARGDNPSCGDSGTMYIKVEHEVISEAKFLSSGCAISTASMSMLTDKLRGMSLRDAKNIMPGDIYKMLGVNITPARVNCALLSYRSLEQVLIKYDKLRQNV